MELCRPHVHLGLLEWQRTPRALCRLVMAPMFSIAILLLAREAPRPNDQGFGCHVSNLRPRMLRLLSDVHRHCELKMNDETYQVNFQMSCQIHQVANDCPVLRRSAAERSPRRTSFFSRLTMAASRWFYTKTILCLPLRLPLVIETSECRSGKGSI